MSTGPIQREGEAAIRQLVQVMRDGQNSKDGELLASAFAQEHIYVAINGMFLPNQTRRDNARVYQRLYDDRRNSVAGTFHNAPVQKQQEAGFVIHIKGVDAHSEEVRR